MFILVSACGGDDEPTQNLLQDPDVGEQCQTQPLPVYCAGAMAPSFALEDIQPRSEGFQQTYGLERFTGKVTVVSLLAAWCPFCRSQAENMERMKQELLNEGVDANFVSVNSVDAYEDKDQLLARCSFPVLQDTLAVTAWDLLGGVKDDIYVYDRQGVLLRRFRATGTTNIRLSTEDGYANLKTAVKQASQR